MDRRKFFQKMIGASAAAAIGPKMFGQIVEQEYDIPNQTETWQMEWTFEPTPAPTPFGGSGVWVFKDEKMIAYGGVVGVTISMDRPIYNVETDEPWETFIPGKPEGSWHIEDLHVIDDSAFKNNEILRIVLKHPEVGTLESDAMFTAISYAGAASESWIRTTADFIIVGEAIIYHI